MIAWWAARSSVLPASEQLSHLFQDILKEGISTVSNKHFIYRAVIENIESSLRTHAVFGLRHFNAKAQLWDSTPCSLCWGREEPISSAWCGAAVTRVSWEVIAEMVCCSHGCNSWIFIAFEQRDAWAALPKINALFLAVVCSITIVTSWKVSVARLLQSQLPKGEGRPAASCL